MTSPGSSSQLSASLKEIENQFRSVVSDELSKLLGQGKQQSLSILLLLQRIAGRFTVEAMPSIVSAKDLTVARKWFRTSASDSSSINKQQFVQAVIIRKELKKLKKEGCRPVEAIQEMIKKVKIDDIEYDEPHLQMLWNTIFQQNREIDRENETAVSEKLSKFGLQDSPIVRRRSKRLSKGKVKPKKEKAVKSSPVDRADQPVPFEEIFNRKQNQLLGRNLTEDRLFRKRLPKSALPAHGLLNRLESPEEEPGTLTLSSLSPLRPFAEMAQPDQHISAEPSAPTELEGPSSESMASKRQAPDPGPSEKPKAKRRKKKRQQ